MVLLVKTEDFLVLRTLTMKCRWFDFVKPINIAGASEKTSACHRDSSEWLDITDNMDS